MSTGIWDTRRGLGHSAGSFPAEGSMGLGASFGGSSNKSGSEGNIFSIFILEMRKGEKRNGKKGEKGKKEKVSIQKINT